MTDRRGLDYSERVKDFETLFAELTQKADTRPAGTLAVAARWRRA